MIKKERRDSQKAASAKAKSEAAKALARSVRTSGPRWGRQRDSTAAKKEKTRTTNTKRKTASSSVKPIQDVEVVEVQEGMQDWNFIDFARSLVGELERISPMAVELRRQVWLLSLYGGVSGSVPLYGAQEKVVDVQDDGLEHCMGTNRELGQS